MNKIGILMADGCEEIEGLTVVDVLRRANMDIVMISINGTTTVTGSHDITFMTDTVFEQVDFDTFNGIVLPGGVPGTPNLAAHAGVKDVILQFAQKGKLVAAICAAPSVLGTLGIFNGKMAVCHPGFEDKLTGANVIFDSVAADGNIITSRGMGTAIDFALAITSYFGTPELVDDVKLHIVYR